jgi:hypothetical protein
MKPAVSLYRQLIREGKKLSVSLIVCCSHALHTVMFVSQACCSPVGLAETVLQH